MLLETELGSILAWRELHENSGSSPKLECSWDGHRFPEKVSESVSKSAIEREIPEYLMPIRQEVSDDWSIQKCQDSDKTTNIHPDG